MNIYDSDFYPTISIQNFKRFHDEVSFELKPITILVGPNGGGKSTIIDAMDFFMSSLKLWVDQSPDDVAWLNSHNFSDIAANKDTNHRIILSSTAFERFALKLKPTEEESSSNDNDFVMDLHQLIKISLRNENEQVVIDKLEIISQETGFDWNISIYPNDINHTYKDVSLIKELPNMLNDNFNYQWKEYLINEIEIYKEQKPHYWLFSNETYKTVNVNFESEAEDFTKDFITLFKIIIGSKNLSAKDKNQDLYFFVIYFLFKNNPSFFDQINPEELKVTFDFVCEFSHQIIEYVREYLNWFRLEDKIDETRENPPFLFEYKSGEFINDYYGLCSYLKSPVRGRSLMDGVETEINNSELFFKTLREFDFADSIKLIETAAINPNHKYYVLQVERNNTLFNIGSLSSGGKQLIPILLSFVNGFPVGNFAIKQPELHLHPKLQMKLADLLFCNGFELLEDCSGGYVVVETHSEHLIRRLQILIAQKKVYHDYVSVLYIAPVDGKNTSEIINLKMDDKGLFTTPWPNGFFEESSVLNIQLIEEILKRTN